MDKFKKIKQASTFGIIGNLFLLIIKGIIGILTKSQAMIADAFNSASDILASLMTYIGNKIASKPQDEDHNLGHGKAEYIYSMLISIIMILLSLNILKNSCLSLFKNQVYEFSIWLIIVCIITIITKLILYIYTSKIAKIHNNLLIKANSKDHLNDCIMTSCNLLSCILALKKIYVFDSIVGIIISIWILISALKIYKESYNVLMDKSINNETKEKVYEIVKKNKEIKRISNFKSTPVGYKYQISFTIYVDGNMNTFKSHKIADKLEKEITKELEEIYLTVVHVNPIKLKEKNNEYKET